MVCRAVLVLESSHDGLSTLTYFNQNSETTGNSAPTSCHLIVEVQSPPQWGWVETAGQISRGARSKGCPHCLGLFFCWAARWPVTTGRLFFLLTGPPFGVSLSWHCYLLVAMSILTRAPSATILTPGTPAPSAIWMWAETVFSALLASSGCISFAPPLPVLTFVQSVQLALQWAGNAQRAIPKGKLAPPLRPVSLLRRLRPLHPLPQGSPHYCLTFINHVHLGAPTLHLLGLLSQGR